MESHLEKELDKPNNSFDDEPCHVEKIRLHNQNIKHCQKPYPYIQRTIIHQKSYLSLKELNWNKNPREAQKLKEERLTLHQKRKKNKRRKGERRKEGKGKRGKKKKRKEKERKKKEV